MSSEDRSSKKHKKQLGQQQKQPVLEVDAVKAEAEKKVNAAGPSNDAEGAQPDIPQDTRVSRSTISLVTKETSAYLTEVCEHYKTLLDDEEKQLLLGNVLEEISGKENLVAGDPVCSRHIEILLGSATIAQLLSFTSAVLENGGLAQIAISPFGSHVVEKIMTRLGNAHDNMNQEEYDSFTKLLTSMTEEVCESLWSFMTDRFATHVARRLLCVLCGSNILSAGSRGPTTSNKSDPVDPDADVDARAKKPAGGRGGDQGVAASGLAAKLGAGGKAATGQPALCRFPQLTESILRVLSREDYAGLNMTELTAGRYAAPFIQAALRAALTLPTSRNALSALVPAVLSASFVIEGANKQGKVLEGVSADHITAMLQDQTASHVLEVSMSVSGHVPGLLDEFITRFFQGQLKSIATHATGNYVLQALLGSCTSKEQVQPLFEELSPVLSELLRRRRGGVVAALVAAVARAGCCHKELCTALTEALTAHPPWQGQPASKVAAAALLCMDAVTASIGTPSSTMPDVAALCASKKASLPKLSTLGGAILINILKLQQGACRDFTDSVVNMPAADLARVGYDPAGARALESLLEGTAPAKIKSKLLASMKGCWAVIASSGSGSFLLEKCYTQASMDVKEQIASELAAHDRQLSNMYWGTKLLARVGAEAYKRDPVQWRQSAESSVKALAQFADLFGDAPSAKKKKVKQEEEEQQQQHEDTVQMKTEPQQEGEAVGGKKRKRDKAGHQQDIEHAQEHHGVDIKVESMAGGADGDQEVKKKKKKSKKAKKDGEASVGGTEAAADHEQQPEGQDEGSKKQKKKKSKSQE